jgi:hypothetical protein
VRQKLVVGKTLAVKKCHFAKTMTGSVTQKKGRIAAALSAWH